MQSLQDHYAPTSVCFGCGPANERGLQIKSVVEGDELVCDWQPAPHHLAFPGVLNGGICGTLLDCHCNWAAAWAIMKARGEDAIPSTVTAEYHIALKKPTPLDRPLRLRARAVEQAGDRCDVEGTIEVGGVVTATCRGTFVAVREGHPAFQRW
jgi:acyl-coenzyme A thioesterase PaaI-like protein